MKLEKINNILSNISNIGSSKGLTKISSDIPSDYYEEKYLDGSSNKVEIYDIGEESIFLKVVTQSDSYGDNEHIISIQFVKPIEKEIEIYE